MTTEHIADLQRTYALVVGIEKYAVGSEADLDGPAHDARRFADWLSARGVPRENIVLLLSPLDERSTLLDQWPGPYKWSATREKVDHTINQMVSHWMGDLLYIFWGGHGVMTATRSRRLFYADTTPADWHHLVLDSLLIHLGSHYLSGFQQQICIVDACANYQRRFSQEQLGVGDTFLPGEPIADRAQFVLLATREGELAKNLSQEQTGYFSKVVLEELAKEPDTLWPPDMEGVAERVKKRFDTLRRERVIRQTPVSIQYQTWDGTKRSLIEMRKQTATDVLHRWVFIAASPLDQTFVLRLRSDLEAQGIALWSQNAATQNAPDQEEALHQAIRMASAVLLIASPDACHSRTVKESLRLAVTYQQPVIVMWARGTAWETSIPEGWSKREYIDARETSYEVVLQEVVARLKRYTSVSSLMNSLMSEVETDVEPRNPYKGLRAFRREDARDFFGRDALVQDLVEALGESLATEQQSKASSRLLAVIGPSGSGKSSVVMAGLIPSLQGGRLAGSQEWIYLEPMEPGSHPLEALTLTLSHQLPERSLISLREDLEADSARGLHLLAGHVAKRSGTHVVLFVDQFEELFKQTIAEEERQHFIDLLVAAITEPQGPLIVLLTMRADFYDRPIHYSELARLIKECQHLVIPMELQDLRAVIEQPAMLPEVQLIFEDSLVGDLLFEVRGQIGALPLLQFTLEQLFERRSGHRLTLQAYHEIGGVRGALAKQAEATYASLPSEEHRKLARALFLRLIDPGLTEQDTTRRRASVAELSLPDPKQPNLMREVADAFVIARLLTTNETTGTTTIEVSHEALIREWPRLAEWLHEAREDIVLQQTISEDATDWVGHGKPVDRLYRGTQLVEGQAWAERNMPNTDEVAFLQAGVAERQHQEEAVLNQKVREINLQRRAVNRLRGLVAVLTLLLVVSIVFAFVAQVLLQQDNRDKLSALTAAKNASARALAANATSALLQNQLDLALLLSVKATQTDPIAYEARNSLLSALEYSPHIITILRGGSSNVGTLSFSPDDRTLLSSDSYSTFAWATQRETGNLLHLKGQSERIGSAAFSPAGQTLVTSYADGVWLWNIQTGERQTQLAGRMQHLPADLTPTTTVAFSPDGTLVASGRCSKYSPNEDCLETSISVWNVASTQPVGSPSVVIVVRADVNSIAFSPDDRLLASSSQAGIQIWDVATGLSHGSLLTGSAGTNGIAFSPGGTILAAGCNDKTVKLWDVASGQPTRNSPFTGHNGLVINVAFSPDGKVLASASADGTLLLWNVASGEIIAPLISDTQAKTSVAFSRDGKTLASGSADGAIILWNADPEQSAINRRLENTGGLRSALFSPNGKIVFTGNERGQVLLQDAMTDKLLATLSTSSYPPLKPNNGQDQNLYTMESLVLSSDGSILAAGRLDGTIILWDLKTKKPLAPPFKHPALLHKIALSSNGHILASGGDGGTIMLWEVAKKAFIRSLHTAYRFSTLPIALSPDGTLLAAGNCAKKNTDGSCQQVQVLVWNVGTGNLVTHLLLGPNYDVLDVAFSPDGHILASSSVDGIKLWDVSTWRLLSTMRSVTTNNSSTNDYYNNIMFSTDGKMLVSYSSPGTPFGFALWDVTQRQPFAPAFNVADSFLGSVAFSPNGQQLASVFDHSGTGVFLLWNITIPLWQAHACTIANRNLTQDEWIRFVKNEAWSKVCPKLPLHA